MSAFESLVPRLAQLAGRMFIESVALVGQLAGDAATRYGSVLDRAIPENWARLTHPEMRRVASLMAQTGWSLAWTPPHRILTELLGQQDPAALEGTLLDAEPVILDDLDRLLRRVDGTRLERLQAGCREALEAHRGGLFVASQATSTVTLAHAVHEHLDYGQLREARRELGRLDPETTLPHLYRRVAVRAALGRSLDGYKGGPREPEYPLYNRHGSAHRLGRQYRLLNSLTAVMLATSVLLDLDDHLV